MFPPCSAPPMITRRPDIPGKFRVLSHRQRRIGQRPDQHQGQFPGLLGRPADQKVHRRLLADGPPFWPHIHSAQPVAAVEIVAVGGLLVQRMIRSAVDRNILSPAQLQNRKRVVRHPVNPHVSVHRGQSFDLQTVRRPSRQKNGHGVVHARVRVNDNSLHTLPPPLYCCACAPSKTASSSSRDGIELCAPFFVTAMEDAVLANRMASSSLLPSPTPQQKLR